MNQKALTHFLSCHECNTNTEIGTREAGREGQMCPGLNPSPTSCVILGESLCLGFCFSTHEE